MLSRGGHDVPSAAIDGGKQGMNNNDWFDINEIANYLHAKIGDSQVSKSTLRRWIKDEADNSHDPEATKSFTTSALGSKKPVTKYNRRLVNAMIEHNLNRIQKKVDTISPALVADLSTQDQSALRKDLQNVNATLQQLQDQVEEMSDLAKRQYRQQIWLKVADLQINAAGHGHHLDAKRLYQDMLNDDFHDDVADYLGQH